MDVMRARTLPEMFFERVRLSAQRPAVRFRDGEAWRTLTWSDLDRAVRETARGLSDWVTPGDRVGLLSENRPEWWICDLAIQALGGVTVPLYPTSPPKDLVYILEEAGVRVLFVSGSEQLGKVARLRADGRLGGLDRVITFESRAPEGGWLLSLASLRTRNPSTGDVVAERAGGLEAEGLATLIYTSGTTGEPKGVMLSHRNLMSNAEGARVVLDHIQVPEWLLLSFLPLSHAIERTIGEYVSIRFGLTVAFARSMQTLVEDLVEVRPTLLVSVPRIYEKLYGRVMTSAGTGARGKLLAWALEVGGAMAEHRLAGTRPPMALSLRHALADRLVLGRIRARLGGRLAYAISGGAPLAPEIARFLNAVGLTVFEGYGLTETGPVLAASRPDALAVGAVGPPWPDVQLRIAPEGDRAGEGEILAKSPGVMLGYYRKPEETRGVFDEDGWFHTGDIGFVDERGYLHITDRKKELIKTSGGKYVAPAPIENALKVSPLVEQAVVVGDRRQYCVALLVPSFEAVEAHLGRPVPQDRARLDQDPEVRRMFAEVVDAVNRDLGSWEQIKRFQLLSHELTQEGGELTPSLKVKRRVVDDRFRELIDALYEQPRAAAP